MSLRIAPLCDVRVDHEYFEGGVCRVAELRPLASCQALLGRYALQWTPTAGGGALSRWIGDAPSAEEEFGRRWREPLPLRFGLWVSDKYFRQYTHGGFAWEWMLPAEEGWPVHFSNALAPASPDAVSAEGILLHEAGAPCGLRMSPASLAGEMPPTTPLPFAVVSIHVGGEAPAFGSKGIVAGAAGATIVDAAGAVTPRHYRIALSARRAEVRYRITRPRAATGDDVQLRLEGGVDASFLPVSTARAEGVAEFRCNRSLPLSEAPRHTYQVVMTDDRGRRMPLPYPRVEWAYPERPEGDAVPHYVSVVRAHA